MLSEIRQRKTMLHYLTYMRKLKDKQNKTAKTDSDAEKKTDGCQKGEGREWRK